MNEEDIIKYQISNETETINELINDILKQIYCDNIDNNVLNNSFEKYEYNLKKYLIKTNNKISNNKELKEIIAQKCKINSKRI